MNRTSYKTYGVLRWRDLLNAAKFSGQVKQKLRTATKQNGKAALAHIRANIQDGSSFEKNSNITIAIKGSSTPLIDTGQLLKDLKVKEERAGEVFVGIEKNSSSYKPSCIIHEGAVVPVTPAMRLMFQLLYEASQGTLDPSKLTGRAAELFEKHQDFYPIPESVDAIIIPARPFFRDVFHSPEFVEECKARWLQAVASALYPRQLRGSGRGRP